MDDMRDIEEIRADIVRTRARLRDTSEALGHKADLPARTISLVGDAAELAGEWLRGRMPPPRPRSAGDRAASGDDGPGLLEQAGEAIASAAGSATGAVAGGASTAAHAVAEGAQAAVSGVAKAADHVHVPDADDARAHPMLVGALALAAGVAAGLAIPASRAEQRAAQPLADEAREAADRLAERATEAVRAS